MDAEDREVSAVELISLFEREQLPGAVKLVHQIALLHRLDREVSLHISSIKCDDGHKAVLNGAIRSNRKPFPDKVESLRVLEDFSRRLPLLSRREREYFDETCEDFTHSLAFVVQRNTPEPTKH